MRKMLLLACLAMPLFADPATVTGTVNVNGSPLPGCTVTLGSRTVVTDANGAYTIDGVEPARYDIKYEMEAFEKAWQTVQVIEGPNAVPPQQLKLAAVTETITLGCSMPCTLSEQPATRSELPSCVDYDLDEALIRALEQNDRSALELLKQRHDTAFTYAEKHRIANALLHHVENDSKYWSEIYEHAENAVRFASEDLIHMTPEYLKWCAEQGLEPEAYFWITYNALYIAAADSRSHDLMIRALASKSPEIAVIGIMGLGAQHDETSLDLIAKTIDRFPSNTHEMLAFSLSAYRSEAADALAIRYLSELDDNYRQARDEPRH